MKAFPDTVTNKVSNDRKTVFLYILLNRSGNIVKMISWNGLVNASKKRFFCHLQQTEFFGIDAAYRQCDGSVAKKTIFFRSNIHRNYFAILQCPFSRYAVDNFVIDGNTERGRERRNRSAAGTVALESRQGSVSADEFFRQCVKLRDPDSRLDMGHEQSVNIGDNLVALAHHLNFCFCLTVNHAH